MLEIDVHCLAGELEPAELSGSVAERGNGAPAETWRNSLDATRQRELAGFDAAKAREYFAEFGAWSRDEIDAWSVHEVRALVLQYAAGDLREVQSCCPGDGLAGVDWAAAEREAEAGRISGNLFVHDGRLFIQLTH